MTNPKSDTFHIKRFSDHLRDDLTVADVLAMDGSQATLEALKACVASHNDLAHHLEQEHERNNQLQEQLDVLHRGTFKAYSDIATLEKRIEELERRFSSHYHEHTESVSGFESVGITRTTTGPLPKGENN